MKTWNKYFYCTGDLPQTSSKVTDSLSLEIFLKMWWVLPWCAGCRPIFYGIYYSSVWNSEVLNIGIK